MARPRNIIRPIKITTTLPEDVKLKLDLHLFSSLEGVVPMGAYQKFFLERIRQFFSRHQCPHCGKELPRDLA